MRVIDDINRLYALEGLVTVEPIPEKEKALTHRIDPFLKSSKGKMPKGNNVNTSKIVTHQVQTS